MESWNGCDVTMRAEREERVVGKKGGGRGWAEGILISRDDAGRWKFVGSHKNRDWMLRSEESALTVLPRSPIFRQKGK